MPRSARTLRSKPKRLLVEQLECRRLLAANVLTLPSLTFGAPEVHEFDQDNNRSRKFVFADIDNDGHRDVVYGNLSAKMGIGNGKFGASRQIAEVGVWSQLAFGYVNQDSILDLVIADDDVVFVSLGFINDGAWTGLTPTPIPYSSKLDRVREIGIADVNGDGLRDLLVVGEGVVIYRGDGSGAFSDPTAYGGDLGSPFTASSISDVDTDGDLDVVVANRSGIQVLRNDGGIFETRLESLPSQQILELISGDVNNDDIPDLLVSQAGEFDSETTLHFGMGDGTFNPNPISIDLLGTVSEAAFTDINRDGRVDIIIGHHGTDHHPVDGNGPGGVSVLLGNSTGSFHDAIRVAIGTPRDLVVEDATGDSMPDIFYVTEETLNFLRQEDSRYFQRTSLGFRGSATNATGGVLTTTAFGDINNDSNTDYAVGTLDKATNKLNVTVFMDNMDGGYDSRLFAVDGTASSSLHFGNFDSDANTEIAVTGGGSISVYELNHENAFVLLASSEFPGNASTVTYAGDLSSDGIDDFVALTYDGFAHITLGSGDGRFAFRSLASDLFFFSIKPDDMVPEFRDFNGDGRKDILLKDVDGFSILAALPNGAYVEVLRQDAIESSVRIGDFDGDGQDDLAYASSPDHIDFYFRRPNGVLFEQRPETTLQKPTYASVLVVDLNDDGISDFLFSSGSSVDVRLSNSPASWQDAGEFWLPHTLGQVHPADLDGDGKSETVLAGTGYVSGIAFTYPQANLSVIEPITDNDVPLEISTYSISSALTKIVPEAYATDNGFQQTRLIGTSITGAFVIETQTPLTCDFDSDGVCDVYDLDAILYNGLIEQDLSFDLNGSGQVDLADRDAFLREVTSLPGDFDFDGKVTVSDLNVVGLHWHQATQSYVQGDANGDGVVDSKDLNVLGIWWRRDADSFGRTPQAAPTPSRAEVEVANVVINEIMYHPSTDDTRHEFIELHNRSDRTVDLLNWQFSDGVDFTFPQSGIPPHGYLVVAADVNEFRKQYPSHDQLILIEGGWKGRLANRGETLELVDANGMLVDQVRYADEGEWSDRYLGDVDHGFRGWNWRSAHDGDGASLELVHAELDNSVGQNWRASSQNGGSPGRPNTVATTNVAPLVTDVQHTPVIPSSHDVVTIYANLLDEQLADVMVELLYRKEGDSEFSSLAMSPASFSYPGESDVVRDGYTTFAAEIPAMADNSIVEFRVAATDATGLRTSVPQVLAPDLVNSAIDGSVEAGDRTRSANFLYQVLNDAATSEGWDPTDQPINYLIMLPHEADLLRDIGDGPLDQAESNAAMNATFIRVDGNGTDVRYLVGVRNRGGASRIGPPNNYRVNIPHDKPLDGTVTVNFNSRYVHAQILGNLIYQLAGLPAADASPTQVRVNGMDLAEAGGPLMYGAYAQLEVITGSFPDNHFPDDRRGNLYRAVAAGTGSADLAYLGPDVAAYAPFYSKRTNEELDDWSDLIELTRVLSEAPDEGFVDRVEEVLDIDQWLRFIALDSLLGNREVGLALGAGDNYWLYRGMVDTRFKIIPHDLDTILGRGRLGEPNRSIFAYTDVVGLRRLLTHPDLVPRYYQAYVQLIDEVFNPETLDPLFDQVLGDFVPDFELDEMKQFVVDRIAGVLSQLPQEFTITSELPLVNGIHRTTLPLAELVGTADALRTKQVYVNGQEVDWSPFTREWSVRSSDSGESLSLVNFGDEWKYLDDGSNQRSGWRQVDFDDVDWSFGPAPLGYGNFDESTTVGFGSNSNNKFITTYFRREFIVEDTQSIRDLTLRLQRDDGAIVYLNGEEIARSNMPIGSVDYQTVATAWVGGGLEAQIESFSVDPNLLQNGRNVLGVEIHQRSAIDDDIRLDASLEATVGDLVGGVRLLPGINRVEVVARGEHDFVRDFLDVWYDGSIGKDDATCDAFAAHGEMAPAIVHAGTLANDTVFAPCGPAYRVTGQVIVPDGVTLSVMPGTTLFFDTGAGLFLNGGRLVATGTQYEPVRFTRTPSVNGTWEGIQFVDSMNDSRLSQAIVEHAVTADGMVGLRNSELTIDDVTFQHTDRFRIRTVDSSLIVRNSTFSNIFPGDQPPTTDNRSEHIWGSGIASDGQLWIEGNHFGTTKGHNDAIDFDGAALPNAIPVIKNNYFAGSGDDAIDFESDAYIVGNTFSNVVKDEFNTATGDANAISAGAGRDYFVLRNVFENVDHAVQVKEDAFLTYQNNTVSGANLSAIYFDLPDRLPGRGALVTDSIFHNVAATIAEADQAEVLEVHRSIVSHDAFELGDGNLLIDPRFVDEAGSDYRLQPGSPAAGAGHSGIDLGAVVGSRSRTLGYTQYGDVAIEGVPEAVTASDSIQLDVHSPGATHYLYRLHSEDSTTEWVEAAIEEQLEISELVPGRYQLEVAPRNVVGHIASKSQTDDGPTLVEWTISPPPGNPISGLRINEVLARNTFAYESNGRFPDAIELYNATDARVDLSGMSLTDNPAVPRRFVFPASTFIDPHGYLVITDDDEQNENLGFGLNGDGEAVYLYDADGGEVDSIAFGVQATDFSIGRIGSQATWGLTEPTLGHENRHAKMGEIDRISINEWFARKRGDDSVQFGDDYVELYNDDSLPIPLGGLYITDDAAARPRRHRIHELSFVAPGGFAVFQADGNVENGPDHLSFGLDATGEILSLLGPNGDLLDRVVFFEQTTDWVQGRSPDGGVVVTSQPLASRGKSNYREEALELTILDWDDDWAYDQSQTDWGTAWFMRDFDDSEWKTGPGGFAHGVDNLPLPQSASATPGTVLEGGVLTTYFRAHFELPAELMGRLDRTEFSVSLFVDDGAAVYVNGSEVARVGLPDGPLGIDTRANRGVSNAAVEGPFSIPSSLLNLGQNLIAVELHQVSPASADAVFSLQLNSTTDNTSDSIRNAEALLGGLRVSEIMYHPASNGDLEFLELVNISSEPMDLAGVRIREGIEFDFSAKVLAPWDRVVVVHDATLFAEAYGDRIPVAGQYRGKLGNGGDRIRLELPDEFGGAIIDFVYEDDWLPGTDGMGRSLEMKDLGATRGLWGNPSLWQESPTLGGTPGRGEIGRPGDLDGDQRVDINDVELLCSGIRGFSAVPQLDLTGDGIVDNIDMEYLILQILGTQMGDANLDGRLDAADLNAVGVNWRDGDPDLGWARGDFSCNGVVDALDLNVLGRNWRSTGDVVARKDERREMLHPAFVDEILADSSSLHS